jgi:hypothetical protein
MGSHPHIVNVLFEAPQAKDECYECAIQERSPSQLCSKCQMDRRIWGSIRRLRGFDAAWFIPTPLRSFRSSRRTHQRYQEFPDVSPPRTERPN